MSAGQDARWASGAAPLPPLAPDLEALAWPLERVAEAIAAVAAAAGLPVLSGPTGPRPPAGSLDDADGVDAWVQAVAASSGLEAEPVEASYSDLTGFLLRGPPAIVRLPGRRLVLAVSRRRGAAIELVGPDGRRTRVSVESLRDEVAAPLTRSAASSLDAWLSRALSPNDARRARVAVANETLRGVQIAGLYVLRLPPSASLWAQARAEGFVRRVMSLVAAHVVQMVLGLGAWWILGLGALQGRLDRPMLVAWAAIQLSGVPVRLLSSRIQGLIAIDFARLVKRRILEGALRLDPEVTRREGAGHLYGRALESGAIEGLAVGAGISAVLSALDLVVVLGVLGAGRGGALEVALLVGWAALTFAVGLGTFRVAVQHSDTRRDVTHELIDQMVGHATRLAQRHPRRWHEGEDEIFERLVDRGRAMDRRSALLGVLPQAFLVAGLALLAPTLALGGSHAALAVSLGGVLLASQSLGALMAGLGQIGGAAIAWRQVRPLVLAGGRPPPAPSPAFAMPRARPRRAPGQPLPVVLEANDLCFSYPGRPEPVLQGASLRVELGDRILVEGRSGAGKSTLAALLSGLARPSSGLLLLDGLDRHTLGADGWRRRVVASPQFHENHVVTETFAYNLLMGRRWPPGPRDLRDAEEVCEALGLGPLLQRMPGGLMQIVGESGWKLSHGERSRLFIARALLHDSAMVVLDESFGALDPETLERCLQTVIQRAPSLVVIAHP